MDTIQKIKKIINENQELFSSLEEADRTGKLRKISYKERANFTIDDNVLQSFKRYCKKNRVNMSSQVERMIKNYLASNKRT